MTINISFNSGLHNVDSFEINGNTEYGSYASFETEDSTFTLGNISCNGDIAESLTITDPNYNSYNDSIFSQYDTFTINATDGTYTIDVDSVFTSVFTVTASANDCDLGDVYVDDVSNRACSISEDITPYADYTLGSVSKLYCKFLNWSDGDKNPIRQMTAGAGGNTSNYNASFTYKFMNNWYINGTEYITFNSTTGMKRGTVNNLTSLTYSFDLTTGIVTDSNNVTYEYDNTNDTFTVNGNTYTKTTNPQLRTLHIDLHDTGGGIGTSGSVGVVNVTTPEDGTVQMYVVYGYDCKRSDYDFKIAPGQSITFTKVFAASNSITFTKEQGTCTYTSTLLSDGLRIDFSDISTNCELRVVLPVNNAAYQNGDYLLDCDWNETGCTWDQGWDLTAAPLLGHGNIISDNYILGGRGCNSSVGGMMYYCVEPKPVTTYTLHYGGSLGQGGACYSTDGTTWSTPLISANATFNEGTTVYIKGVPETGYQFQKWSDDNTDNPRQLTMNSNLSYTALFVAAQPTTYEVTVLTDSSIIMPTGSGIYNSGASCTLTAMVIDPMYEFEDWITGSGVLSTSNPYTFTVTGNVIIYGRAREIQPPTEYYTISVSTTGQGTVSGDGEYEEGTTATLEATPASGWVFDQWFDINEGQSYYDNPWQFTVMDNLDLTAVFMENTPVETYTVTVNVTGQGTTTGAGDYEEGDQVTLTATPSTGYEFNSWQINGTVVETNSTYQFTMGNQDVTITAVFVEEAEKHIYLCDNSGAHLAEMTKTGSTWSVSGAFTSGMYSIRATVEGEYDDAWFKFYQTSGDNRVFVGAGDDPSFEDIGTYIMIDDILTSFSLTEDQETGYYVVNYQNTGAMTVSMVDTIVNSYIGDFVTGSEISAMGYITATDISSMGYMTATDISAMSYVDSTSLSNMSYITMTDVQSLGYIDQTTLDAMSYVDQTSLSSMAYVDNTYLSTYMNSVVGDINSILQTI